MTKITNSTTKGKNILINKNGDIISGEYDIIFLDSTAPYLYIIQNKGYYNILSVNENGVLVDELLENEKYIEIYRISRFGEEDKNGIFFFKAQKNNGLYDFISINIKDNTIEILFSDVELIDSVNTNSYILKINNLEYIVSFENEKVYFLDYGFKKIISLNLSNLNCYGIDKDGKYRYFYFNNNKKAFQFSEIITKFDTGSEYLGGGVFVLEKKGYKGMFVLNLEGDLVQLTEFDFFDIIYQYSNFHDNFYKIIDKENNEWLYTLRRNNDDIQTLINLDK